jgi:hypothetical protein
VVDTGPCRLDSGCVLPEHASIESGAIPSRARIRFSILKTIEASAAGSRTHRTELRAASMVPRAATVAWSRPPRGASPGEAAGEGEKATPPWIWDRAPASVVAVEASHSLARCVGSRWKCSRGSCRGGVGSNARKFSWSAIKSTAVFPSVAYFAVSLRRLCGLLMS